MLVYNVHTSLGIVSFSLLTSLIFPAYAQVIPDGTSGTIAEQNGDRFEIEGGQRSGDGANLFHSFAAFGLEADQVANFVTTPEIQNILGRVTGGNASSIDGLIQVTGSSADVFLMNPAGIIFGETARLDVAGDFTATTAGAIEFESGWFEVLGDINGSAWTGEPIAVDFSGLDSGAIVNLGELTVAGDANLNLFGGTVLNAGTVSGGNVSLTAVSGGQTLQLSAAGNVLGLEVATDRVAGLGIAPIALPELLTGGHATAAGTLTIGEDGIVQLSGVPLGAGDSGVTGTIDVSGELGGVVQVLGDRVLLAGAAIDASGEQGGGAVYLGGEYRGGGTLPTAAITLVDADSTVNANATQIGDGGEVIVWADGTAGFFGEIMARGGALGGDGGFVETSGAGSLVFRGGVDVGADHGVLGSVLLDPTNITISSSASDPNDPANPPAIESQSTNPFAILASDYDGQDITINSAFLQAITGNVTLEATNDITLTSNLTFSGTGSITFKANADGLGSGAFIATNSSITAPGRNLTITGNGIDINSIDTSIFTANGVAGNVTLTSANHVSLGLLYATGGAGGTAGVVDIQAGGNLQKNGGIGEINLGGESGGSITINTVGNVNFDTLQGQGRPAITVNSGGSITLGMIDTHGGDVNLTTTGNVGNHDIKVTNQISTAINNFSSSTQAGNVTINSAGGILTPGINTSNSSSIDNNLRSGNITLSALNAISIGQFLSTHASGDNARSGNISVLQSESFNGGTSITSITNGTNSISGAVNIQSSGAILGYEMLTYGFGSGAQSGNITINGNSFNFNNIQAQSSQTAGNVAITTTGDLTIADLLLTPSSGATGTGGNITLTSGGNITANRVFSTAIGNAGDISFQAGGNLNLGNSGFINALSVSGDAGNVLLRAGTGSTNSLTIGSAIDAFSYNGAGGSGVNIQAGGNIQLGTIQTGASQGSTSGDVAIVSTNGNINLTQARSTINNVRSIGDITAAFPNDPSLNAIKDALSNLQTNVQAGLASSAPASNITLSAANGTITATGNLDTYSQSGAAGQVQITSGSGLTLRDVTSYGNTASGNLTITSTGAIATTDITTLASSGKSGNVTINGTSVASGNVSSIAGTGSGNITVTATDGTVTTRNLSTTTTSGSSGSVTVGGTGNVTTGNITSSTSGTGNSGNITVESSGGSVTTGDVTTESAGGNSGNIDFSALIDIITGNLTSSAGQSSGDITLDAGRDINTGDITSAAVEGDSGDISLTAGRDITAGDITSSSENGQSGNIGLVAGGNINTGNITTQDGQISLNADGTIATGDLSSDNVAIVNGELLETSIDTDNFATIATQQRETAIATIQADSSLNPNTLTATTTSSVSTLTSDTSDAAIVNETQSDVNSLAAFSSGFLSIQSTNVSLDTIIDFDDSRTNDYTQHFGGDGNLTGSVAATREAMANIEAQTGIRTGVVYVSLRDTAIDLSVITAADAPLTVSVPVDRTTLLDTVATYRNSLINARYRLLGRHNDYAAQLYDWLIRPIATDLEARGIDTLMLSLDVGLRGLPIAALYDGEHYLIERYSLSLIPSMGLVDTRYQPLSETAPMLAMGASEFTALSPLPAVPAELDTLVNHRRNGEIILNADFTRRNIIAERDRTPYPIVHLATHGEFNEGSLSNSYIQLWDERIGLDNIRELGWHDPPLELLVLSACQTALGNAEAEMGFAGLAVAAGVKTAIASLWYVDDAATFMLMTELYHHLAAAPIKADALRLAQLALMRGQVRITDGMLYADGIEEPIPLPASLSSVAGRDFSNPYYWSGFTAIGAPW